jgi:hypothetical protein
MLGTKPDQVSLPVCDEIFARGVMIGLNPFSTPEIEAVVHDALKRAADA